MGRLSCGIYTVVFMLVFSAASAGENPDHQKLLDQYLQQVSQAGQAAPVQQKPALPEYTIDPLEPDYVFTRLEVTGVKGDVWIEAEFRGELEIRKKGFVTIPIALQKDTLLSSNLDKDTPLLFKDGYLCAVLKGKRTYPIEYTVHIDMEGDPNTKGDQPFRCYLPVHSIGTFSITLPGDSGLFTQFPCEKKPSAAANEAVWTVFTSGDPVLAFSIAETRGEKKVRYSAEERISLSISDADRHSITRKSIIKISIYEKKVSRFDISVPGELTLSTIKTGFNCSKHIEGTSLVLIPSYPIAGEAFIMIEGTQPVIKARARIAPAVVSGALFQKGSISIAGRPNISIADIKRDAVARSSAKSSNTSVYFYSSPEAELTLGITPNPLREMWDVRTSLVYTPEKIEGRSVYRLRTEGGPVTSVDLAAREQALCTHVLGNDISSWRLENGTLHIGFSRQVSDTSFDVCFSSASKRSGSLSLPGFVSGASRFAETVQLETMPGYILTPVNLQEFKIAAHGNVNAAKVKGQQQSVEKPVDSAMLVLVSERAGNAEVRINKRRPLINGSIRCCFNVLTDTVRLDMSVTGTVSQKHITEMDLGIPSGYLLDRIRGTYVKGWDRTDDTLTVRFTQDVIGPFSFTCSCVKPFTGAPAAAFNKDWLPQFDRVSARVEIAYSPFFEISSTKKLGMNVTSKSGRNLVYTGSSGRMSCECAFSESPLKYETYVKNFLFIRRGKVEVEADLNINVPSKPAQELTIRFSEAVSGFCEIKGDRVESYEETGKGTAFRAHFTRPVTGRVTLSLVWSVSRNKEGRFRVSFPYVESGTDTGGITALIKSDAGVEVLEVDPVSMTPADLGEKDAEEEGLVSAFLYEGAAKALLSFKVIAHATRETSPVTCPRYVCSSFKARQGYITVLNAPLFNRSAQNIRMKMKEGHTLVGTYINGEPVKPMLRKGSILVPAARFSGSKFVFTAVYEHDAGVLTLPEIQTAGIMEVDWEVQPDPETVLFTRGEFYDKVSRDLLPAPLYSGLLNMFSFEQAATLILVIIAVAVMFFVIYIIAKYYFSGPDRIRILPSKPKPVRVALYLLVFTALIALIASMFLPVLSRAREEGRLTSRKNSLRQIGLGLSMYAQNHEGRFPENPFDLYPDYVSDKRIFPEKFFYVRGLNSDSPSSAVVMWEDPEVSGGEGANVLYADAHVEWHSLPLQMFSMQNYTAYYNRDTDRTAAETGVFEMDLKKYKRLEYDPMLKRDIKRSNKQVKDEIITLRPAVTKEDLDIDELETPDDRRSLSNEFTEAPQAADLVEAQQFIAQADKNIQQAGRFHQRGIAEKKMKEIMTQTENMDVSMPASESWEEKRKDESGKRSKKEIKLAFSNVLNALELDPDNDRAVDMFWGLNKKVGNDIAEGGRILNTIKLIHLENKRNEKSIGQNLKKAETYLQQGDLYNAGNWYNEALSLAKGQKIDTQFNRESLKRAKEGLRQVVKRSRMEGGKNIRKSVVSQSKSPAQDLFSAVKEIEKKAEEKKPQKEADDKTKFSDSYSYRDDAGLAAEDLVTDWEDSLAKVEQEETRPDFLAHRAKGRQEAISTIDLEGEGWVGVFGVGGGGSGAYGWRDGGGRHRAVGRFGGGTVTETSAHSALQYLKNTQNADGSWHDHSGKASTFLETSYALLVYLGAGHTQKAGIFRTQVARGLAYIVRNQNPDGSIGSSSEKRDIEVISAYAMALAEAYGMTKSASIRESAQKAVSYLVSKQGRDGFWKNRRGNRPHIYGTMCAVCALKSGRSSGLDIGDSFEKALKGISRYRTDTRHGYFPWSLSSKTPHKAATVYGVLALILMNRDIQDLRAALKWASQEFGNAFRNMDIEYIHAGTLASFQMGGDIWKQWNDRMKPGLISRQRKSGPVSGSWDPAGVSRNLGRIYTTAKCALNLQVYYRYLPVSMLKGGVSEPVDIHQQKREEDLQKHMKRTEKIRAMHKAYARNYYKLGKQQYDEFRLEEAKENLKIALRYNPEYTDADKLLEKVQGLLGERPERVQTFYKWATQEQKVKIQQKRTEMKQLIEQGDKLSGKGDHEKALEKYQSALQIHRWLPYNAEFPELKKEMDEKYKKALSHSRGREKNIIENMIKDMQGHYNRGEFSKAFEKADAALRIQRDAPSSGVSHELRKKAEEIYHTAIAQKKIEAAADEDGETVLPETEPGPDTSGLTYEEPAESDETGLKAEVLEDFRLLKQKESAAVSGETKGGRAAGVKPLRIGFEYSEGNVYRFRGRPRGGEIKPLEMTVLGYPFIQRIGLVLMLAPLLLLFSKQTWKTRGVLACIALAGILAARGTESIYAYCTGHIAAGFTAVFCISVLLLIFKYFTRRGAELK